MKYIEFGSENSQTVILLHGGGLSWWNYREEAEILKSQFHIIIPFLDGHAGSDKHFSTIESNADDIISFINRNWNGSVLMICGLSLGGQILLEMLSRQKNICQYALVESAMAFPSKITHALIRPSLECSYPLIKKRWFARLQFRQLRIKENCFDDYYRDTCIIGKDDMIAFLKANTSYQIKDSIKNCGADVHICYGEKETIGIKKSAGMINRTIPASSLVELPGMYHGDFSVNHAELYAKTVKSICK